MISPYNSNGHRHELILHGNCINCGEMDHGLNVEEFDPETIWQIDEQKRKEEELFKTFSKETVEDYKKNYPERLMGNYKELKKDGKKGYLIPNVINRESHYEFMKNHWECKRQFPFPNKFNYGGTAILNDSIPIKIPTWKSFNDYWDKAHTGIWPKEWL